MTKNILATGIAGFIGSNYAISEINKGNKVIGLDLLTYAANKDNLSNILEHKNFKFFHGDISDSSLVSKILREYEIDYVVNFAAESHVDNSISGPDIFIKTNINGTYNLLQSSFSYYKGLSELKKEQFRYLQISTDEVYGSLELDSDIKFNEKTNFDPSSPYSASKAAADHLVKAWHITYGLPTIITHCTNNYGPRQHTEKLIPKTIFNALNELEIPVYGNGKNVRDWIYVDDHNMGVSLALTNGIVGETYCFGGNAEKTNIDVVTTICIELDKIKPRANGKSYKELIKFVNDRPGHDLRYAIDDSYAKLSLGFERKYNFEQGIIETLNWYLKKFLVLCN